jgi:hypothetical protein
MRLHELELTKLLRDTGRAERLADKLSQLKPDHPEQFRWKLKGTGAEALVAQHPHKPYVLKLFPTGSRYVQFVDYVQAHQTNPHLPKFGKYVRTLPVTHKFDIAPGRWSYVTMEILQPVSVYSFKHDYVKEMCAVQMIVNQAQQEHKDLFWNSAVSMSHLLDRAKKLGFDSIKSCGEAADENWKTAIRDLLKIMKTHGMDHFDLHYNNVMLRGDVLVIVDPFI